MKKANLEQFGITIDETPEEIFIRYQKKREVKDYQKLYNMGIALHYSNGAVLFPLNDWVVKPDQKMVAAYDMIGGVMTFTKIWVY